MTVLTVYQQPGNFHRQRKWLSHVTLLVNAPEQLFEVVLGQRVIKRLPIKGLVGRRLPLAAYIERMQAQARPEERQRRLRDHLRRQV